VRQKGTTPRSGRIAAGSGDRRRVVQDGPAAPVARRPATEYVARLVGLNLLRGEAAGGVLHLDGGMSSQRA